MRRNPCTSSRKGKIIWSHNELGQGADRIVADPLFPYSTFCICDLILHKGLARQDIDCSLLPGMPAELSDGNGKQVMRSGHALLVNRLETSIFSIS